MLYVKESDVLEATIRAACRREKVLKRQLNTYGQADVIRDQSTVHRLIRVFIVKRVLQRKS